jgi:glycosyltransferase involved in cell wall biosynthesis
MANRYFVCSRNSPPVGFDIAEDRPVRDAEIAYFARGFRILEQTHDFDGWTVCFAWSSTTRLPELGERVIAVIYGDEHCRIPAYVGKVHAVIKGHGLFPPFRPRRRPLRLAQIEAAEFLRNLALWLPSGWRYAFSRRNRERCHLVPIGYGIPSSLPPVEFERRRYLTSFLGSVANVPGRKPFRTLIGTPKTWARTRLVEALRDVESRYGPDRVKVAITADFQASLQQASTYEEVMAQTQICVSPRGTTPESWRLFDALKAGCVVVADKLPLHPYWAGHPVIEIEDWRDLPALLEWLLSDPAALRARSEASLRFWRERLSEEWLARRYAEALNVEERRPPEAARPHAEAARAQTAEAARA